jgi:hypothetical protein
MSVRANEHIVLFMSETSRLCRLNEALGVTEECPEEACPFREPGGAVVAGRCAFDERLDLSGRRDMAGFLMQIRGGLGTEQTNERAGGAPPLLSRSERRPRRMTAPRRLLVA